MAKAKIEAFWMYNSERFLRFASEQLEIKLTKGSVESVREVARVHSRGRGQSTGFPAEEAVKASLIDRFGRVRQTLSFPDFICLDQDSGLRHGFEVKVREQSLLLSTFMMRNLRAIASKMELRNLDVCTLIIVLPELDLPEGFVCKLDEVKSTEFSDNIRVLIGTLEGSPLEFRPIHEF